MNIFGIFGGFGSFLMIVFVAGSVTVGAGFLRKLLPTWMSALLALVLYGCGIILLLMAVGIFIWVLTIPFTDF